MSQGNSTNVISLSNTIKGTYSGSVATFVKVDDSGSMFTLPDQKTSTLNTTTVALSASTAFTGSAELNTYPDVMVSFTENKQVVFSLPVSENTQDHFEFTEEIDLQPVELITVACKLSAGAATYANVTLNTREDQ